MKKSVWFRLYTDARRAAAMNPAAERAAGIIDVFDEDNGSPRGSCFWARISIDAQRDCPDLFISK